MNQSTMTHPDGNCSGPDDSIRTHIDSRFGLITFDGAFQSCLSSRGPGCLFSQNLSVLEDQARRIKEMNPHTRVLMYRNLELARSVVGDDCRKMVDSRYNMFFLHNREGNILDYPSRPLNVTNVKSPCHGVASQSEYFTTHAYFLDWRNTSTIQWWLDVVIGDVARSKYIDGFFWDDPSGIGSEHRDILGNFTKAEIAAINANFSRARTMAEVQLATSDKWAITYPDSDNMNNAMPVPQSCVPMPCGKGGGGLQPRDCHACARLWATHYNCTCDRSPSTCVSRLQQAAAAGSSGRPALMTLPFPGINDAVACTAPAGVAVANGNGTAKPKPLELSCVPGSGVLNVTFASFGRPTVNREGRFIRCTQGCPLHSPIYWEDAQTNTAFELRPEGKYRVAGYDSACAHCLREGTCKPHSVNATWMRYLQISRTPFSCAVVRDCTQFRVNPQCDAGAEVLQRVEAICQGKQSCRVDIDLISNGLVLPPSCSGTPYLAIRTTGCKHGAVVAGFRESLAAFLLARGPHAWMGHGWIADSTPVWFPDWDVDFGVPLGPMVWHDNVVSRNWTNFQVQLDCNTFEATFNRAGL